MISQKSIQEILNIAQIEDTVGEFVNLRRRGVNMIGLCPFHNEKTPSFTVSPTKNIYKCFGCGKGGNSVQFIMEHEQMSFPDSIRYFAKKYNIELEETERSEKYEEEKQLTEALYLINEFSNKYFQNQLWNTDLGKSVGLSYFKSRGFRESTIKDFQLGYAPDVNGQLYTKLIDGNYNKEYVFKLGLSKRENSDFFRARVMFPIHNLSGKVIGFGGRTLSQNKKTPKYLNSPESEIYNKSRSLYGLYFAKKAIRQEDECILVEGYTDTISLHQAEIQNVVASSGTSLTVDQIKLIKRYTNNIKVLFDGDAAGIKAAQRGMNLILEQNMNISLVPLPDGEDPDSYLSKLGTIEFKEFLNRSAKDFLLFKVEQVAENAHNNPIEKANLIKDILESIAKIPDTLKRAAYIQQCAKLLDMKEEILFKESNKIISADIRRKQINQDRGNFNQVNETSFISEKPSEKQFGNTIKEGLFHQEKDLARIAMEHGSKVYDEEQHITIIEYLSFNLEDYLETFENPVFAKLIKMASKAIESNPDYLQTYFTNHIDSEIQQVAIDTLSSPYSYANWDERGSGLMTQKDPGENHQADLEKSLYRYLLKRIRMREKLYKEKIVQMQESGENPEEISKIIRIYQELQQEKKNHAKKIETNLTYRI